VYCSKTANGKYSICEIFDDQQGNILSGRIEHNWVKGRCVFCGANEVNYERGAALETHAYQFIHTEDPEEIFKMKFDVIVGNPPYQLSDGGFGKSASPIYQKFVQQAMKLGPRFLTMIIPSRWFAGGKGLNEFRSEMLNDEQIRKIVDFEDARECFPGVDVAGGICYFLWKRDSTGPCEVINISKGKEVASTRRLNEFSTFIRHGKAVPIIRKVLAKEEKSMSEQVSSRKPFGLPTNVRPNSVGPAKSGDITLRWTKGEGPYRSKDITVGVEMINKWKVITSKTSHDHAGQPDKDGMRRVLSVIDILRPGTVCTESYLVAGVFGKKSEAERLVGYLKTRFVRFLVSQLSFSQDITKDRFLFVPILSMDRKWTDEELYKRYGFTESEIAFIESKIRPMDLNDE
jgi:site-specific DNA-methyltransferase (adenine-specific)